MKKITFLICCALCVVFGTQAQDQPPIVQSAAQLVDMGYELNVQSNSDVGSYLVCGDLPNFTQASSGGGPTSQDFEAANDAFDNQAADDFVMPDDGILCALTVPGTSTAAGFPGDAASMVVVEIYDDAAGAPGTMIYTESFNGPAADPGNTGTISVTPTSSPVLTGGTTYWISVIAQLDFGVAGQWFWDVSGDGNGTAWQWQNPGDGFGSGCTSWADGNGCIGIAGPDLAIDMSFEAVESCLVYDAAGLPANIDLGGDVTIDCAAAPNEYTVTVAETGLIGGSYNIDNVEIDITHTFDGDLDIWLRAPSGTELELTTDNGGAGDDYTNTVFQDGGADITAGTAPFTGTFEPEGGTFAAAFAGEDVNGDWKIILCDDAGGDTGTFNAFSLTLCPTNDTCENATSVACGDVVTGNTDLNSNTGGNAAPDQWFSFQGSGDPEIVTLSLCDGGTNYDSFLRVFDACGGTEIAANDDSCGLQSELTFLSDGTSEYFIMVEGFGSSSGDFSLEVTCVDPEPNDLCDNAIDIACGDTVSGSTVNASIDDVVAPFCDTSVTSNGVWYRYDDTSGLVTDITVTMCNSTFDYDTKLSVYSGDCAGLVCVAGNDDTCGLLSEVSFQSDGNTTFYILVHGFGGATGSFEFDMNCTIVPPPNDMIANSIDVDEIGFPYTDPGVQMPGATTEAGNPTGCNIDGAAGVWYNFVPEGDGQATAEIISPAGTSSVQFFSAPDENAVETDLELVPGGSNQCVPGTSALINTVAGQAYYVFVVNTGGITDIVIDGTNLGVEDNVIQGFSFAPNPVDNLLELNSVDVIEGVEIYNILGQQVIDLTIDATRSQIDVSSLQTGTYIMKATVNGQVGTYKIIKE